MRTTLVFPPFHHPSMYNLPPLGLLNLASALRQAGHAAMLVDQILGLRDGSLAVGPGLYAACAAQILATEPEVVAFSAQCTTYPPTVQIARILRQRAPQLKLVIGGHNATFVAAETLASFPWIDAVVRGEGEVTLPQLVSAWDDGGDGAALPGVTTRRGREIVAGPERELIVTLDDLPLPDYAVAPTLEAYRVACALPRRIAILEVGRGCPHACVYCSEAVLWRRRCRTFSVPRILAEMRALRDLHGAGCLLLAYDQFTADRRQVREFCEGVIAAGLSDLAWYCISRLDTVDGELLELMRAAGCESMCYGIDSGSPRTLAFIRKQIDPAILPARVAETTARGMVPTLSFVIGFPEEERADIDATLRLALETGVRGNSNPLLQIPTVLPGTELHRRYADTLVRAVDSYFALGIEFDGTGGRLAEDEALIAADRRLFSSFWNLPCRGLSLTELSRLASGFALVVNLYPRTFLLLSEATSESPSRLFAELLAAAGAGEIGEAFGPAECFRHFPPFVARILEEIPGVWPHLAEVLAYETHAIEAARFALFDSAATIDLSGLSGWRPRRARNLILARFSWPLPQIVADLQQGRILNSYPATPAWLIFRQQGGRLEVKEINRFGHDLLELCRGDHPLEEIARQLHPLHGGNLPLPDFQEVCRAAAQELNRLALFEAEAG